MIYAFFGCFFAAKEFNAQKTNQFDNNNKRTGVWKKHHANKRIRYQGTFKNGKEIGVFRFYDTTASKSPIIIKKHFETNDTVFVQFFTSKGRLQSEGKMLQRIREGKWKYYFATGNVLSEENYKNGKLDGVFSSYYPQGDTSESVVYKKGVKHGVSRKYSKENILIEDVYYENGKLNGEAKFIELNGNIKEKGLFKDGKRFGKWKLYIEGKIATDEE